MNDVESADFADSSQGICKSVVYIGVIILFGRPAAIDFKSAEFCSPIIPFCFYRLVLIGARNYVTQGVVWCYPFSLNSILLFTCGFVVGLCLTRGSRQMEFL